MSSKEGTYQSVVGFLLNIFILSYVFLYVIKPVNVLHAKIDKYKYAEYDAVVYDCSQIYFDEVLSKNTEIDSFLIRDISLMEQTIKSDKGMVTTELIETVKADSLENVKGFWIPDVLFESYDDSLVLQENAILLPREHAKKLDVEIGDLVYIEDDPFVVAGTFINDMWIDGVILSNDTDKIYNGIYIKFKNPEQGIDYIKNNYYTQGYLQYIYGDSFLKLATEEEIQEQVRYYETRELQLKKANELSRYDATVAISNTVVGLVVVFVVQVYVNHKTFEQSLKFYAIKISSGYSKRKLIPKCFFVALLQEILVLISSLYIYCILFSQEIRKATFFELFPAFIITIIFAAIVLAFLSQYELRNNKILKVLRTEE